MKFHQRFGIDVGLEEAQRRFVNRIQIALISNFFFAFDEDFRNGLEIGIAYRLGDLRIGAAIEDFPEPEFLRNLHIIEAFRACFSGNNLDQFITEKGEEFDGIVLTALSQSEIDLEIEWRDGQFVRKGAELLDNILIVDTLHWLRDTRYASVLKPFDKGLRDLLRAQIKAEGLSDVVTDMYEAVEALAKIITGRPNKDLSGNSQLFLKNVNASEPYKVLLKAYVDYANLFRHAEKPGQPKPTLSEREVESFVYLTGTFIRLAMPA